MKTSKKLILFITGLMILGMIVLFSCNNRYTGPNKEKGIFNEGGGDNVQIPLVGSGGGLKLSNGYELPPNSLSQSEQDGYYNPEFNSVVLFRDGSIPALTITSNGVILAAAGTGENANYILVKRSSDMGKNWTESKVDTEFDKMYTHTFFINSHDGSVLMGVATTNKTQNKTTIFKSSNNGETWEKKQEINHNNITNKNLCNSLVNFGQGITLRHQKNVGSKKLMFPYFYYSVDTTVLKEQKRHTAIMLSENNGDNFSSVCSGFTLTIKNKPITKNGNTIGDFTTYEPKLIELSDGSILLAMFDDGGKIFWAKSADCGKNWTFLDTSDNVGGKRLDLVRYEFNGKPIRGGYDKDALMIYYNGNSYGVKMTTNDFSSGNPNNKYRYGREGFASGKAKTDSYPAITVLPDGTIATLTDEANGVVFRRFNLNWLTDGMNSINYETDLKF